MYLFCPRGLCLYGLVFVPQCCVFVWRGVHPVCFTACGVKLCLNSLSFVSFTEGPYFEAFLMTYRTFVSSDVVLEKLLETYPIILCLLLYEWSLSIVVALTTMFTHDFYLTKSDQLSSRNTLSLLMRVVDYLGYVAYLTDFRTGF